MAGWRSVDESRQDESFSEVITKSIENPEALSLREVVQLGAYYSGILDQMLSAQTARETGLVDGPFSEVANTVGAIYFSNEFARSWWKQVRPDWSSPSDNEFQETMDEAIIAGELGRARRIYEGIQNELSQHPKNYQTEWLLLAESGTSELWEVERCMNIAVIVGLPTAILHSWLFDWTNALNHYQPNAI